MRDHDLDDLSCVEPADTGAWPEGHDLAVERALMLADEGDLAGMPPAPFASDFDLALAAADLDG